MARAKTEEAREFYLLLTAKNRYSTSELERQIDSMIFERSMISDEKNKLFIAKSTGLAALRDNYVLEFLDIPHNHKERELRKAILSNLKDFILEFGKDFSFVGEEYRVQVGNSDFKIDLLFFNRELTCLVAIELKVGTFKPEHLGQLEFYLEALDGDVKKESENPSVGLILCADKDDAVVEYALRRSISPALVANYQLHLPNKKLLEDKLKLVIVRDMWLTGFDVPSLHTLYLDKPMKGHNLMQAIARVNRVYKDKTGGLIVDYLGIASDLKKALSFYSDAGGKGDPAVTQEKAVRLMLEKLEIVSQMFHGFAYKQYFKADTGKKLSLILSAEEHILGLENGKKRFIDEVTALSQAFSIAIPHDKAMGVKDEVAFFQAVKSRLVKFNSTGADRTDEELETAIRQVIDKALVTEQVIDVFDAAGIKKPDISILSEDFLLEVKNMEHKNIALEVLKKLLNDEIKSRAKKNLIQSKTLMEMLETSIKKYQNRIISAAEFIEELIGLAKEIHGMDKEPREMGLSDYEYAFYAAIANNNSARQVMQQEKLRELAVVLYEKVRENASIDWTIKENVKAKLKVIVKRTLRKYGYPPDMQALATETVLKQAELIAWELTK